MRAIPNAAALPEIHAGRLRDHAGVEDRLFARGVRPPGHRWCRAEEEVCHGSFPVAPLEFYLKFGGGTAKPKNQWTQAWFLVMGSLEVAKVGMEEANFLYEGFWISASGGGYT